MTSQAPKCEVCGEELRKAPDGEDCASCYWEYYGNNQYDECFEEEP